MSNLPSVQRIDPSTVELTQWIEEEVRKLVDLKQPFTHYSVVLAIRAEHPGYEIVHGDGLRTLVDIFMSNAADWTTEIRDWFGRNALTYVYNDPTLTIVDVTATATPTLTPPVQPKLPANVPQPGIIIELPQD